MFGKPLDSHTLIFSMATLSALLAAFSLIVANSMPASRPALHAWSKALLACGVGFFLLHMRYVWPWFVTSFVANSLILVGAAFGLAAHARLLGLRIRRVLYAGPLFLGLSGIVVTHAFALSQRVIVGTVSAGLVVLFSATGIALVRAARARWRPITAVSATSMLLLAAVLAIRVALSVFGAIEDTRSGSSTATHLGPFLLGLVYTLIGTLWIFDAVHEKQRQAAIEATRRDGLTGLYTRTAFFDLAGHLLAQQPMSSCAVVMVDIDHFKRINDSMGHAAGDTTLAHAARCIANSVRLFDLPGRYGGEEFCILLPGCDIHGASELAERLVKDAARQSVRLRDGQTVRYTLSAGYVATNVPPLIDAPIDLLSVLLERADQALYRAKHGGRNRAVAATRAAERSGVELTV